jgi:cytochrome b
MSERPPPQTTVTPKVMTTVWDWPLRIWHWAFALVVCASLVTGWLGEVSLMTWHLRLGYCVVGLLLFRLGWALWGGRYARLATFRTSPRRFVEHFRGRVTQAPRTAPGAALALLLVGLVALQAGTGLFTSDEIFTEGPLARLVADDTVGTMSAVHHRVFWGVATLIGVHLLAHVVYAVRRDPTPLAMFTGRKPVALEPARHLPVRALITAALAVAVVWWGLSVV